VETRNYAFLTQINQKNLKNFTKSADIIAGNKIITHQSFNLHIHSTANIIKRH
jgi:hypothetical protein